MSTHVGILPVGVLDALAVKLDSETALRFLRLPHPRTGIPSLFLPYVPLGQSKHTILEVQAVAPPNPRSWFMSEGEVIADGKLLMMTPIDPAFLLMGLLQTIQSREGNPGQFRPYDDIFEDLVQILTVSPSTPSTSKDPSLHVSQEDLTYLGSLACVQCAMKRICEFKEITSDITVYRYSASAAMAYLQPKVARLSQSAVIETSRTLVRVLAKDGLMEDGKESLLELGRIKAACDLLAQYLPQPIYTDLLASYDFTTLDAHLQALREADAAAILANASNAAPTRKKGAPLGKKASSKSVVDDDEKGKKRKAGESVGVGKLKKANVIGMKPISSFFGAASKK
ncbi:hypothetical protein PUNSTDRAFT_111911 [Punctularia strigosozonata HHB-11173 SS5]|uniref:uncharacterized protein n=1 Tax=Punctularia strigosozonata (strain HHB-11173) TaxID=741275 RepID=UPI00044167C8|nr:uncharacterized protein PUNSTDRAFT_111911 [Punctularia strigosozonata HHB-11173 SS5]EIN11896.1 hypothetical protein PUNSTDRAFT_111911 [Punctularia strigosozonata HHB-11173 SS5]